MVYDLAARAAVAEAWSADDVLRFGTPAAEPRLTDGFHREAGGASAEAFLWSKARGRGGVPLADRVVRAWRCWTRRRTGG